MKRIDDGHRRLTSARRAAIARKLRHREPLEQWEVAVMLGIARASVAETEARALRKLRVALREEAA